MTSSRLLLVTPTFHDYWVSIADAFGQRGYSTTVCRYDELATRAEKVHNKVGHELPQRLGRSRHGLLRARLTRRAVSAVRDARPDIVLTVKGDLLDSGYWDAVDASGARHVLWLYDELRRTEHDEASLSRARAVASYSPADVAALNAAGHPAALVPLAFDPAYAAHPGRRGPTVTFVGARYPRREETLLALSAAGVPVRAFGRDWSRHLADRLRTWNLRRPAVPSGGDLTRPEAYAVMAGSLATLNIHGDQDGFTMRTFEACGVGALQLVDRSDITDLYEPGTEVLTYDSIDELTDLCRRAAADVRWADGIRSAGRRRTLAAHTFAHRAGVLESLWA